MTLVSTLTQSLRTAYPSGLDKQERRESRYGAKNFFMEDTTRNGGILPSSTIDTIKRSFGNSVVIPVIDDETVTIGNTRSCTIADSENTSSLITLTFVTYAFGFSMYPAQHYNNDIDYQADFDVKLKKYLLQLASLMDTACINQLETDRNQFFPAAITGPYYPVVANALQITQAQKNDYYNQASSIMEEMDFYGNPHVITSTSGMPNVRRLDNQGSGNAVNEQFQLSPYEWWGSNRVVNAANVQSTHYVVEEGNTALVNRNDPDAILKHRIGDQMEWDTVFLPIVGMEMASFYRKDCNDANGLHAGTTGLTRTLREGFEFSTDVVYMTVHNSDRVNRYNPIVKVEIATT